MKKLIVLLIAIMLTMVPISASAAGWSIKKPKSYTNAQVAMLARIIWAEARGESNAGQMAVGTVVMNRAGQKPKNIKKVLQARGQFGPCRNWQWFMRIKPSKKEYRNARKVLNGKRNLPRKVKYFNGYRFRWAKVYKRIGYHYFMWR